jgi:hypothetical protein
VSSRVLLRGMHQGPSDLPVSRLPRAQLKALLCSSGAGDEAGSTVWDSEKCVLLGVFSQATVGWGEGTSLRQFSS